MIKFECTWEDLSNLGYPKDMKKEMLVNFYFWSKENKDPMEFKCTIERSVEYCDNYLKETEWLK